MRISSDLTDDAILAELGDRVREARLLRNLSQEVVAAEAGVAVRTLNRMESGEGSNLRAFVRVLRALGQADNLDVVVPAVGPSPVDLARRGTPRRRAAPARDAPPADAPFRWGDER